MNTHAILHVLNDEEMEAVASIFLPKDSEMPQLVMLESDGRFYYYDLFKTVTAKGEKA